MSGTTLSPSAGLGSSNFLRRLRRHPSGSVVVIFGAMQLVCIAAGLLAPDDFRYLSSLNIESLLRAVPQLGIIALGVGLLMIAGEFDLSVGAVFTMTALVMAETYAAGMPLVVAIAAALAVGIVIGLVNAVLVLRFRITSFIATLAMMMLLRGIILFSSGAQSRSFRPGPLFQEALTGAVGVIQAQFLWFLALAIVAYLILERHRLGNGIYAVGGNRDAANAVGVRVAGVKSLAFVLCSLSATLAGIVSTTRVNSVSPIQGQGLELQAIAACVIGGIALTGGRGAVLGIVLGAALIYSVQDVLLLSGAPGYYLDAFVGLVILAAAILNRRVQGDN